MQADLYLPKENGSKNSTYVFETRGGHYPNFVSTWELEPDELIQRYYHIDDPSAGTHCNLLPYADSPRLEVPYSVVPPEALSASEECPLGVPASRWLTGRTSSELGRSLRSAPGRKDPTGV